MEKQTVMVIEDDPALLKLYGHIVEKGGYQLLEASNAKTALDILKHHIPHIIVEDLSLPDLSGLQLIHCIRQLPNCANIPAIIISGSSGRIESARLSQEHFVAFLHKPIAANVLLDTINTYLP